MKEKRNVLRTRRLVMKPLEEGDREAMLRMLTDERIRKTYMIPVFRSRERADAYYDRLKALSADKGRFIYGIYLDGGLIGFLNDTSLGDTDAELGYFISPEHWGHGYAAEALGEAIRELFDMGYSRVIAGHFEENAASRRVMEKCGMRPMDREESFEYRGVSHRCLYRVIEKDEAAGNSRAPARGGTE